MIRICTGEDTAVWHLRPPMFGRFTSVGAKPRRGLICRLDAAGHAEDLDGPLFRPLRNNGKVDRSMGPQVNARHTDPDAIDHIVRKRALRVGLARDYSAHSMRATFITTALKNGAKFEDVQDAAGRANPSTTRLYDKRGYDPAKSASFFANY